MGGGKKNKFFPWVHDDVKWKDERGERRRRRLNFLIDGSSTLGLFPGRGCGIPQSRAYF